MQRFLSPKTLAQAVGVSESSLKRWADDGLLHVARTAGGHRRIDLREALRYIRAAGLPLLKPELLGLPELDASPALPDDPAAADRALAAAITAGNAPAARAIVTSLYLAGRTVASLCDGPLAAALREVGDLWRHGPEGIFVEHRATDITTQCLHTLRSLFPPLPPPSAPAPPPAALGGAVEGDPYALPTLMVSTVLAAEGWNAINLGPNLPTAALLSAVGEHTPSLVWLACSVQEAALHHAADLQKAAETLARRHIPLITGGRGWPPHPADRPAPATFAHSLAEIAAFLHGLQSAPKRLRK